MVGLGAGAARRLRRASLTAALTGEGAPYATEPDDLVACARRGRGRAAGGCLSILAAAAGTPLGAAAATRTTVLFLEDVDEKPYRIDRMLLQLRASGALRGRRAASCSAT